MRTYPSTLLALFALTASAMAADAIKPVAVTSRITAVTVYSDRARVTREAPVTLRAGTATYRVTKLPGWIDEATVRAGFARATGQRITDVQIKRDFLATSDDENIRKAQTAVQDIADQLAELDDERKILDQQRRQIEQIRMFSLERLPKDAVLKDIKVDTYGQVVTFVANSLRDVAKARRAIDRKRRDLQPELTARQRTLNELNSRTRLEQTTILVTVESGKQQDAVLSLTYMLPGASWEPVHELRATGNNPKTVGFSSYAVVSQTTGEDWTGVKIAFSTQSPSKTIRIPKLDSLLLGSAAMNHAPMQRQVLSSFNRANSAFKRQTYGWNTMVNPGQEDADFQDNWKAQALRAGRVAGIFKKIEKRGTTAHFQGTTRPTIRTGGRDIRVPIGKVDLVSTEKIIAAPEASASAARTLVMTNTSGQPILPGSIALYHNSAFLGMTAAEFVGNGEAFSVFLNVADDIKIARVMDRKNSKLSVGKRTRMDVVFHVSAENLSGREVALTLADRIPVSQDEDIRVYYIRVRPEGEPDNKGLTKWNLKLKPKEKKVFRVSYTVDYTTAALQRARRASKTKGSAMPESGLYEQINDMEMMLK
jgi:uncharacterized protein (TIGR02231 family)